jgi:hypothetical protein
MIRYLLNGTISDDLRESLLRCRLIPFRKPGTSAVRPIAIGETFLKAAGVVLLRMHRDVLPDIWGSLQVGVGTPAGIENAIHAARAAWAVGESVASLDMRNAFNTLSRHAILEAIRTYPTLAPFHRFFNLCYGTSSALIFSEGDSRTVIPSTSGVRQGDVLGPLFFALGTIDTLKRVAHECPGMAIVAYLDDITVSGRSPSAVAACCRQLGSAMRQHCGLELNPVKSQFLLPSGGDPSPFLELGFPSPSVPLIKVLGAFVGRPELASNAVTETAHRSLPLFDALRQQLLPPVVAFNFLRVCGIPRLQFFLRTHPLPETEEAVRWFDREVTTTFESVVGCPLTPVALGQARLPAALGGCGLRSQALVHRHAYPSSAGSMAGWLAG